MLDSPDQSRTTDWPAGTKLLHVLGAGCPHDEVLIVGTEAALREMHAAIGRALEVGRAAMSGTLTRDGEGYWPIIIRATDEQMDEVPLHYVGDLFASEPADLPRWLSDLAGDAAQEAMANAR